ncbi:MAG: TRAP-type C4-dicarboxylate transport system permease large subunit [Motiliproteus sp.]|jgi:TRAP-type C4-dicarboxylate transport system permease large subunit
MLDVTQNVYLIGVMSITFLLLVSMLMEMLAAILIFTPVPPLL